MPTHTGSLGQYLLSFLFYTLTTIGLIYGVYWYTRKTSGAAASVPAATPEEAPESSLVLESALPLEPQKTLYVVRSGSERFLISATGTDTQLLSKLEPVPAPVPEVEVVESIPVTPKVDLPWYADQPVRVQAPPPPVIRRPSGFGSRLVQSIQWLVASRTK